MYEKWYERRYERSVEGGSRAPRMRRNERMARSEKGRWPSSRFDRAAQKQFLENSLRWRRKRRRRHNRVRSRRHKSRPRENLGGCSRSLRRVSTWNECMRKAQGEWCAEGNTLWGIPTNGRPTIDVGKAWDGQTLARGGEFIASVTGCCVGDAVACSSAEGSSEAHRCFTTDSRLQVEMKGSLQATSQGGIGWGGNTRWDKCGTGGHTKSAGATQKNAEKFYRSWTTRKLQDTN